MKNIEKKNKAIQICLESKETLTPNRITILELLLDSEIPISAYDLSTKLKNKHLAIFRINYDNRLFHIISI